MRKTFLFGLIFLLAMPVCATNLIFNGNFESGNTGFFSSYSGRSNISDAQTYAITTDPSLNHPTAVSYSDHTSGSGSLMMAVNAATSDNVTVWGQTVAVEEDTDYRFSMFVSLWLGGSPPQLDVLVNGNSVDIFAASGPTGVWEGFSTVFSSGNSTSLTIQLIDRTHVASGDDFAIDDLALEEASATIGSREITSVPEAHSFLLLLLATSLLAFFRIT